MACVIEADASGNEGNRIVGFSKSAHGFIDAQTLNIFADTHTLNMSKKVRKVIFIQIATLGNILKRNVISVICFDIFQGLVKMSVVLE